MSAFWRFLRVYFATGILLIGVHTSECASRLDQKTLASYILSGLAFTMCLGALYLATWRRS